MYQMNSMEIGVAIDAQENAAEWHRQAADCMLHMETCQAKRMPCSAEHERLDAINAQQRGARASWIARSLMGLED